MPKYDFKPMDNKRIINNEQNESYLTISKNGIGLSTGFIKTEQLIKAKHCIVLIDIENKALAITFKVYDENAQKVFKVSGDHGKKYRRISVSFLHHDWITEGRYIPKKEELYYVIDFK